MLVRRTVSAVALAGVLVMLVMAALTPMRAERIAELDAEAERIGRLWAVEQTDDALVVESNEFFEAARDLEPPLGVVPALGTAMLLAAVAVAGWPNTARTAPASGSRTDLVDC